MTSTEQVLHGILLRLYKDISLTTTLHCCHDVTFVRFVAHCSRCVPVDKVVVLCGSCLVERLPSLRQTSQAMHCQQQQQPPSLV